MASLCILSSLLGLNHVYFKYWDSCASLSGLLTSCCFSFLLDAFFLSAFLYPRTWALVIILSVWYHLNSRASWCLWRVFWLGVPSTNLRLHYFELVDVYDASVFGLLHIWVQFIESWVWSRHTFLLYAALVVLRCNQIKNLNKMTLGLFGTHWVPQLVIPRRVSLLSVSTSV